jgi:acyl transferase domain-containing protein/acyl carrier protein
VQECTDDGVGNSLSKLQSAMPVTLHADAPAPSNVSGEAARVTIPDVTAPELCLVIRRHLAAMLGVQLDAVGEWERFRRLGLESVRATAMVAELGAYLGRTLSPTLAWRFPTPRDLARHLAGESEIAADHSVDSARNVDDEPIAIVGIACRVPGATDPRAFWEMLRGGVDAVREPPANRWAVEMLFDTDVSAPGKVSTKHGGFLDDVAGFDASFFGISEREAVQVDPQQRLFLELAWEALEDAGVPPGALKGTRTGVFAGAMWMDYATLPGLSREQIAQHTATGRDLSIIPARVSYTLGLQGPSITVNTACSSSLVAVHLARQSILRGESRWALAGGVNLMLSPDSTIAMSKFGGMAPDGRCKAFDARANGYVRGEGGGIVVLKRLSAALADRDYVYCVIRGSAVNNDGFSNGLTAPNPLAQEAMLRDACRDANIAPGDVQYVEAHGTGTTLGDPIEVGALGAVLGDGRGPDRPLLVGSVKTNVGHLEAAAGVVGLIKVALAMAHGEIPASLHFERPNPHIPFEALGVRVQATREPWPAEQGRRLAGVSSFGFGGTNAHVILERPEPASMGAVHLAAGSEEELAAKASRAAGALGTSQGLPSNGREGEHRLVVAGGAIADVAHRLERFGRSERAGGIAHAFAPIAPPKVAVVCGGIGSQWVGMGKVLLHDDPVGRAALRRCDAATRLVAGWSLIECLQRNDEQLVTRNEELQLGIFAMQVAFAEVLLSRGLHVDAFVGQSLGEIAAAHLAGALSVEDAVRVVHARSQLVEPVRDGCMAVVPLSLAATETAIAAYRDDLAVAVAAGPESTIVAGCEDSVEALRSELAARGVSTQQVHISYASHSRFMDPLLPALRDRLRGVCPRPTDTAFWSTVTGGPLDGRDLDAAYWARNLRDTVLFAPTVKRLVKEGFSVFIEVDPHPVVARFVEECLEKAGRPGTVISCASRGESETETLREAAGSAFLRGCPVAAEAIPAAARSAELVVVSARTPDALRNAAGRLAKHVSANPDLALADLAYSSMATRVAMAHRAGVVASSRDELMVTLDAIAAGEAPTSDRSAATATKVAFVFSGQGSQWHGMARELLDEEPAFADALRSCDAAIAAEAGWSVIDELRALSPASHATRVDIVQPSLFAMQVSLAALWRSWGVHPAAVVGHSMGEIAAACISGAMRLRDGAKIVCRRSSLLRRITGCGGMAVVELSAEEARAALNGVERQISIAVSASPRSTVLSGESGALAEVLEQLRRRGVFCRTVKVDYASHSAQVDPVLDDLVVALADVAPGAAVVPMVSTVTGNLLSGPELTARYWANNLREPVWFAQATRRLIDEGVTHFIEVSPHPLLVTAIDEIRHDARASGLATGTLRRDQPQRRTALQALGSLHVHGVPLDAEALAAVGARRVALPTYAWQRERYWLEVPPTGHVPGERTGHPLLGVRLSTAGAETIFELAVSAKEPSWLDAHRLAGRVLVPGAMIAELVRAAAEIAAEGVPRAIASLVLSTPMFIDDGELRVQVVLSAKGRRAEVHGRSGRDPTHGPWVSYAQAEIDDAPMATPMRLDLKAIRARCAEAVSLSEMDDVFATAGLAIGDVIKGIVDLRRGEGEAIAEIALDDAIDVEGFALHPLLLDAALRAIVGALVLETERRLVLYELGRFVLHRAATRSASAHVCVLEKSAGGVLADVIIVDQDGEVIAEARRVALRIADPTRLRTASALDLGAMLYRVAWQPSCPTASTGTTPRGWAVVDTGDAAKAASLAKSLRDRGENCEIVALDALRQGAPRENIVYHASGDCEAAEALRAALDGLAVVQAIGEVQSPPRVWWLTRGAVSVAGEDVVPAAAAVWGLARTVLQERPELRCTLVDVASDGDPAEALSREASFTDEEDQVAWRREGRSVPRLRRVAVDAPPDALFRSKDATVLVTGGLGALGLHAARALAEFGIRHLLLVGRRGAEPPGAAEAIEELRALGALVTVAAVDVADCDALAELLATAVPADAPLLGVVHAAGVTEDGLLRTQTPEQFARLFASKVEGAWNLHLLTRGMDLDMFALFSSTAGTLGSGGTGAYAAANAYLDALATHRGAQGLTATSLAWGPWADGGMATALHPKLRARFEREGLALMSAEEGKALFTMATTRADPHLVLARVKLSALETSGRATPPPIWRALVRSRASARGSAMGATWSHDWSRLPPEGREKAAVSAVSTEVARALGLSSAASVPVDTPLRELGLDSLLAVALRNALSRHSGVQLAATLAFDYPTAREIARHLVAMVVAPDADPRSPIVAASSTEPIAVVAMACRFPGGVRDPEALWELLEKGGDAVREVPADRWDIDAWYSPDPEAIGKMNSRYGGFIDGFESFDAPFFGLSPREARAMDPQGRLLLETAWEALERAGVTLEALSGSNTGVYMGLSNSEYRVRAFEHDEDADQYSLLGNAHSTLVGRISYWLGLKGPSVPVDTACSSSLVAVHLAAQALRSGECSLALAGGANVILDPRFTATLSRMRALSPTGRCRAFSADADGFVRAEGAGMIVLERLSDARKRSHPVLALLLGSAINQDGRSNGLTAPNGPSQQALIRQALSRAGISPARVGYVECHGTGTPLGDPIEVQALAAALSEGRPLDSPVVIGSLKTNVGHMEAAAGVGGLMKAVLALRHQRIPKSLHFESPNPHIPWSELPVKVAVDAIDWQRRGAPRVAGVSSFGFAGTNAHVLLQEAPEETVAQAAPERDAELVVLSAHTPEALRASATQWKVHFEAHPDLPLGDIAFSAATTRSAMAHRVALTVTSRETLIARLASVEATFAPETSAVPGDTGGKTAWLFSGQGSQSPDTGRRLYEFWPAFRDAFDAACAALDPHLAEPLKPTVWAPAGTDAAARLSETEFTQPALFALQWALAALWRSWGVVPDYVVGHSVGEVAGACVAGVLTLRDAARLVCTRGRLMQSVPERGGMLAIEATEGDVASVIAHHARLAIAAVNSPSSVVVSGGDAELAAVAAHFAERGTRARRLNTSHAFHSPLMEPMVEEFAGTLADIDFRSPAVPFVSTVTGAFEDASVATPAYWVRHIRQPVLFWRAMQVLVERGVDSCVEMGPRATLTGLLAATPSAVPTRCFPSLRGGQAEIATILAALGGWFVHGGSVFWPAVFPGGGRRLLLPTYAWQRSRHWIDAKARSSRGRSGERVHASDAISANGGGDRYRIAWVRSDLPAVTTTSRPIRWIVVADRGGVGARLADALEQRGHACTCVPGDEVARDPVRWNALVDEVASDASSAIVHLASLDLPVELDGDALVRMQSRVLDGLVALVRSLVLRRVDAPIHLVTRAAQATDDDDKVEPHQAAAWGFARTLRLEQPHLFAKVIDLPAGGSTEHVDALVRELLGEHDSEDEVALRGRDRRVPRIERMDLPSSAERRKLCVDASYLVTGGLGALGIKVAGWLAERGAGHVVLVGRRPPTPQTQERIEFIRARTGCQFYVRQADCGDAEQVESIVASMGAELPPLRGVIHAAGVLDDGVLHELSPERMAKVLAPKVYGGLALHHATGAAKLDFFVLFSSAASLFGSAGQGNYAAANAFLDGLAAHRRALGLPAVSVQWGAWADGGMAAELTAPHSRRVRRNGVEALADDVGLAALEGLLVDGPPTALVQRTDWDTFVRATPHVHRPMLYGVARPRVTEVSSLASALAHAQPRERGAMIRAKVRDVVGTVLGMSPGDVPDTMGFFDQGFDSLMAVELRNRIQREVGAAVQLPSTLAFDHPTVERLASHIERMLDGGELSVERATVPRGATADAIAIVGLSCRVPGAEDAEAYWRILADGVDVVREVPSSRWDIDAYYNPDPDAAGRMYSRSGGFVDNVETFDASFFGIAPREALRMDPQHRLLLEGAWAALESAAIPLDRLKRDRCGVFVGISNAEYAERVAARGDDAIDAYFAIGGAPSAAAGRLSHSLDLQGPAMSIDTACSSSLVAVHQACQSLRAGGCDVALAGGVNLILSPQISIGLSRARMLAPDGRCKTFDAGADGYVRSEGCGLVVLKRLTDAEREGDRVLAVILGTAVNQDGRAAGITVPNGPAQDRVITEALREAGVEPWQVDYLEAHGTGTPLGDPIEVNAAAAALGRGRAKDRPVLLGAVKSNIGHLEAAAGIAGLIKVVLSLQHQAIPANLHFERPNPRIAWEELPVRVVREATPWPVDKDRRRLAGVSSFGFTGTNAHVVVEEAPPPRGIAQETREGVQHVLCLSAKSAEALRALAGRYARWIAAHDESSIADVCYTAALGRAHLEHRASIVVESRSQARACLSEIEMGGTGGGSVGRARRPKAAWLFGSRLIGANVERLFDAMGPPFRDVLDRCDHALAAQRGRGWTRALGHDDDACTYALQVALAAQWRSWGVEPEVVLGCGVGEITAATVAGILSPEDGLRIVARRQELLTDLAIPEIAVVCAPAEAALHDLDERTDLVLVADYGAYVMVRGAPDAISAAIARWEGGGVRCHRLASSQALPWPAVDSVADGLLAVTSKLDLRAADRMLVSCVMDEPLTAGASLDPSYWQRLVREPIHFARAVGMLSELGCDVALGLGAPAALVSACWPSSAAHPIHVVSFSCEDGAASVLRALAELFVVGVTPDFASWYGRRQSSKIQLPTYPFERNRYWVDPKPSASASRSGESTGLLGPMLEIPTTGQAVYPLTLSAKTHGWIADHRVYGTVVVPGVSYVAMMLAAADLPARASAVSFTEPLFVPDDASCELEIVAGAESERGERTFEVFSRAAAGGEWRQHAVGVVGPATAIPRADAINVEALKRHLRPISPDELAQLWADVSVCYGSTFETLTHAWLGDGTVLSRIAAPPSLKNDQSAAIHPALLDACTRLNAEGRTSSETHGMFWAPWRIDAVILERAAPPIFYAYVGTPTRVGGDGETRSYDIELFDDKGAWFGRVEGFTLRRAPRDVFLRRLERASDALVYTVRWQMVSATPSRRTPARWFVVGDNQAEIASVRAGLAELGEQVVGDASALDDAFAAGCPCTAIAYLAGGTDLAPNVDDLDSCRARMAPLLSLARVLAARGVLLSGGLHVVTRGAVAARDGEQVDPTGASVWGFVRALQVEQPLLGARLIDLRRDAFDGVELATLLVGDHEPQVAKRGTATLVPRLSRGIEVARGRTRIAIGNGSYLVTGGTGGLGLECAAWLAASGASDLVLVARSKPSMSARERIARIIDAHACSVHVRCVDVSDAGQVDALFGWMRELALPPLRGVVHAAGTLDDGLVTEQTWERFSGVFAGKALGALHLDRATQEVPLDFFVVYSSLASLFGASGQSNYAAANGYVDGVVAARQSRGLTGVSVQWGPWADVGMASRQAIRARVEHQGYAPLRGERAHESMLRLLEAGTSGAVAQIDWSRMVRTLRGTRPPLLDNLLPRDVDAKDSSVIQRLRVTSPAARPALLLSHVQAEVQRALALSDVPEAARGFFDLGMDSLMAVELRNRLNVELKIEPPLGATSIFDYPTAERLAEHLVNRMGRATAAAPEVSLPASMPVAVAERGERESIAIVGMGLRVPGARDADSFWELLRNGVDAVRDVPRDRWDIDAYFDEDVDAPGKMYVRRGAFLDGIDQFDADFFGISPREARYMDPQQRLLLEVAWEALEDAGWSPQSLRGSSTGVFVGAMWDEYATLAMKSAAGFDPFVGTGNSGFLAGRVSYQLGLRGPSIPVNTACSSSLVAIHLAAESLRRGECERAIVGGVNLMVSPEGMVLSCKLRALARDGRCKTFDASADGYGRGEGCGVLVLRRLSDARASGDRILALIRGSAVNHNGTSSGLTVPSGEAQTQVIAAALADAGVDPASVGYLEAHGTGTVLGDPIELRAAAAALGAGRPAEDALWVGSVKTNIGHLEGAAGMAGIMKTVLALRHGEIPPHLHLQRLNPAIESDALPIRIPIELTAWPNGRPVAGVSSFGMSGTNGHVVLERAPEEPARAAGPGIVERRRHLLPLSAKSAQGLRALAGRYVQHLDRGADVADLCYSAATGRAHFEHRAALVIESGVQAREVLKELETRRATPGASMGQARSKAKLAWVFAADLQPDAITREAYARETVFRDVVDRCVLVFGEELGEGSVEVIHGGDDVAYAGARTFVLQLALATMLRRLGIEPDVVSGQGVGEYAAACVAGAFTLEQGARLVVRREVLRRDLGEDGVIFVVHAPAERVTPHLDADLDVEVTADYGAHLVLSGRVADVATLRNRLARVGVLAGPSHSRRRLPRSVEEHAVEAFAAFASSLRPRPPERTWVSSITGEALESGVSLDASYWGRQLRAPSQCARVANTLSQLGCDLMMDVGARGASSALGSACWPRDASRSVRVVVLDDHSGGLEATLASLYVAGITPDFVAWDAPWGRRRISLPTYPFQRRRHWIDAPRPASIPPASDRYRIEWESVVPVESTRAADTTWLILADHAGVCDALAEALRARGHRCEIVRTGNGDGSGATVDAHIARLRGSPRLAIVHLCSLDLPREASLAALDAMRSIALETAVAVVRACVRCGVEAPIYFVTRNAQPASPDDVVAPHQSPLWGLARVVGLEHPKLLGRLIDVHMAASLTCAESLARELLVDDGEDEVALRAGKRLVPRLRRIRSAIPAPVLHLRADGKYLVTGGLGGLGLHTAAWLAERGAGHIVLTSRHPPSEEARRVVGDIARRTGATVVVHLADVSDPLQTRTLIESLRAGGPQLRGVLHAAGIEGRGRLVELSAAGLAAVLAPKAQGAWLLHELTRDLELDLFVMFSSIASVWGSQGQGDYAAANAFLDGLAHARRADGLPATSLNYGPWEGLGMVDADSMRRLARVGVRALSPARAVAALSIAAESSLTQVVVADVEWATLDALFQSRRRGALFRELRAEDSLGEPGGDEPPLMARLHSAHALQRPTILRHHVRALVARVLGQEAERVDLATGLFDLGMNSLSSVELQAALAKDLGLRVPATLTMDHPTVDSIVSFLLSDLVAPTLPAQREAPPRDYPEVRSPTIALEDAEVARLLQQEIAEVLGDRR